MSGFTSEGFNPFPNTYEDNKRVGEFANERLWPTPVLEQRVHEYANFLRRTDIMARARAIGERVIEHATEELAHRDGMYKPFTAREEDELCQSE